MRESCLSALDIPERICETVSLREYFQRVGEII